MADASTKEAVTNTTLKSSVDMQCDCNVMWSLAQQFSTKRLCIETGEHKGKLVRDYAIRARRIAATYARFYLELEDGGDKEKIGRYYWMALGAFASKTVACTFEAWQVEAMTLTTKTVWEGLGKGNFWLFCDISGWHWYRNMYPASFDKCMQQRNAKHFVPAVKVLVTKLPWNDSVLPIIKYFAPSKEIENGFAKVREYEQSSDMVEKEALQLEHLLEIAKHEQEVILQPLIYDNPAFAAWVQRQRAWYAQWASPALELVFTHQCSNKHLEVKSIAPEETKLENLLSRMNWINDAAKKFHGLMRKQKPFMHSALSNIAAWADLPDEIEKRKPDLTKSHDI